MNNGRYEVRLLEPAQTELEEIARLYMSLAGPESARGITERILDALEKLALFPLSGPAMHDPDLREQGYRFTVAGKFVAVYRLIGETVYVYHIFDGRTNYPKLFKAELED